MAQIAIRLNTLTEVKEFNAAAAQIPGRCGSAQRALLRGCQVHHGDIFPEFEPRPDGGIRYHDRR